MFWNKREKELEEKYRKKAENAEFTTELFIQLLTISKTMEILDKEKFMGKREILEYGLIHIDYIISFVSRHKYFRATFEINEKNREEYLNTISKFPIMLMNLKEIPQNDRNVKSSDVLFYMMDEIIKYANPENGYNIAKVF